MQDSAARHQVLIVGGGSAGITVAARLLREDRSLDIAVIEPAREHFYQPLWTLVGGGVVPKEVTRRQQEAVIPEGVRWIHDSVASFEPDHNRVNCSSGKQIGYDFLVVAPGIQLDWKKIEGLEGNLGRHGICSNYSYEHVEYTWECIRHMTQGTALFTFPNTPIKCAGAPQKIMYLAEHHFRREDIRDRIKVGYVSAAGTIFGVKKYAAALDRIIEQRGIETLYKHNLVAVDATKKQATFQHVESGERKTMPFDLLHVTPPMSAPDFVKKSPLASAAGWVDVDKHTLQHTRHANIFSLGDASSLPTSKTGAAVRKQAPVLVANLLATKKGEAPTARYGGYTSCPLVTGYGKLILAEFDYDGNPQETFPFDQSKERWSMYQLKRHVLPRLYWDGMLKGRA